MTDILAVVTIGDRYKVWRLVPGAWCLVHGAKGPNPPSQGYGGQRPKSSRERRAAKKGE